MTSDLLRIQFTSILIGLFFCLGLVTVTWEFYEKKYALPYR